MFSMSPRLARTGIALLAWMVVGSASAAPFTAILDEFWIVKNGSEIFRDSFDDGSLPPSGPDGIATYGVFGAAGMTSESAGKLTMTPSLGDPVLVTTTYADLSTNGTRLLATNPANPNFLGQPSSFTIHGLFDLSSLPEISGQSFGIRATDRAPALGNEGNNVYALFLGVNPMGDRVVALRLIDFLSDTSTVLASISVESLLPGADQIEFMFSKAAGSDLLTAAYTLFDHDTGGFAGGSIGSSLDLRIYDGEAYIRGEFQSTDQIAITVPEPSTLAVLSLGLLALALSRRSKRL